MNKWLYSLLYFTVIQQSGVFADYPVYRCSSSTNCFGCSQENAQYTSEFGTNTACISTSGCPINFSSDSCQYPLIGMFYDDSNDNDNLELRVDVPTTGTYVSMAGGKDRYITNYYDDALSVEVGCQFTNTRDHTGMYRFENKNSSYSAFYLSNSNNNFTAIDPSKLVTLRISGNTELQIKSTSITGIEQFEFHDSTLSVPDGGTVTALGRIDEDNNAYLKGSTSSTTPLTLTGAWTGIRAPYYDTGPGALYLTEGFIYPQAGAFGADSGTSGNIILQTWCTLMIGSLDALGNGTNSLSSSGGVLSFTADVNLPNNLSFGIDSYGGTVTDLSVDMQGNAAQLSGTIYRSYNKTYYIVANDTSAEPGSLYVSSTIPTQIGLNVAIGTMITNDNITPILPYYFRHWRDFADE